jgi:deoxyadenosine/deoxycytidine kinase
MLLSLYTFLNSIFLLNKIEFKIFKYTSLIINKMNHHIKLISIEGNIGSGKSTLLESLKKHFKSNNNIIFLKEPVDEWSKIKDENGITILEKFYCDQEKYSFSFQMMAYISRLKLLKETIQQLTKSIKKITQQIIVNYENDEETYLEVPTYIIITERSLFTDKMVFAKMLYDTGKIEHVNYQIYLNCFNAFADEFTVNKVIYVRADPETCHQRISTRHRDGENNIPIDYLKSCTQYHENMLNKNLPECVCNDQLVLDGNHNIYKNENILKEWIDLIKNFIYN